MEVNADRPQTPYEVFCQRCRVSHPMGTKRCLHCGEPIDRGRFRIAAAIPSSHEEEVREEELPAAAAKRLSPIAALWLLLAIGAAMYRACASG
jgi:hypothetical protein